MIIGVWVMVILYLGFPGNWDRFLLIVTGLIVIFIAYRMKSGSEEKPAKKEEPPYVDYHSPTNDKSSGETGIIS